MTEKTSAVKLPQYAELDSAIERLSLKTHLSEIHGTLCGFIGVGAINQAEAYIKELIEDVDVHQHEADVRALVNLLQIVYQQMETMSFDFHLLVPDDDAPLPARAKAMSRWCHGYSDGFLQSGIDITELKTDESRDALYHITEVSQLDYDSISISEEDEKAFVELYEYVRMAVLMIHSEVTHKLTNEQDDKGDNKTVH